MAFAIVAAAAGECAADVVVLRNGRRVGGTVRLAGDRVEVTTGDGQVVVLSRAEVDRIDTASGPGPATDFAITDALRQRADVQRRLKELGAAVLSGGPGGRRAARELLTFGPEALPALTAALGQDDKQAAGCAVDSLAALGLRSAADAIAERLPSLDSELQAAAIDGLVRMRAVHTIGAIAKLIEAEGTGAKPRQAAVRALGTLGNDLAIPALITALTKAETARAASDALAALGSPAAVPYLEWLAGKDDATGRSAAGVLAKVAGPEHAALLLRLKRDGDASARAAAGAAFARLEESKADRIATYIALVNSGQKREADAAAAQLRKLTRYDPKDDKEWAGWWLKQNQARMRVGVVAVGDVDGALVRQIERALSGTEARAVVLAPVAVSAWGRIPGSARYRADALLDLLDPAFEQNAQVVAVVAVTAAPVELPGAGPVIGAFRPGRSALISLPGLECGPDAKRLKDRLARYSLHALSRALRIRTAESNTCPAVAVYEAAEIDRLSDVFSTKTEGYLKTSMLGSALILSGDCAGALRELSALEPAAEAENLSAELATLAERNLDLKTALRYWTQARDAAGDESRKGLYVARIDLIDRVTKAEARGGP